MFSCIQSVCEDVPQTYTLDTGIEASMTVLLSTSMAEFDLNKFTSRNDTFVSLDDPSQNVLFKVNNLERTK